MTMVVAVGHDVGVLPTQGSSGDVFHIRLAREVLALDASEYGVWRALREGGALPASIEAEIGAQQYDFTVRDLTRVGLLTVLPSLGHHAGNFARRYRLAPLARGIGYSPDEQTFQIYLGGEQAVGVSGVVYLLWSSAPMHPNLYETIDAIVREPDPLQPQGSLDASQVWSECLGAIPALIGTECAYLDLA